MLQLPILLLILTLTLTVISNAAPINTVVVYGDSLADNGNFFAATGQPSPPYFQGRFSNGKVAVEDLVSLIGTPQLLDYAYGGATTGIGNHLDGGTPTSLGVPGLPGMTKLYNGSLPTVTPLAPNALFVVWGGPNDFLSPSPLDPTPIAQANRAVANLVGIVNGLEGIGAKQILVPGMPDIGLTPFYLMQGPVVAAQATALTNYFNGLLAADLPAGATYFDTAGLLRNIVANPGVYGLTNVTTQCFNSAVPSLCGNPGQYLFWDDFHPTARGHVILANAFAAAIPEPSTWVLCFGGIAGFAYRLLTRAAQKHRF